MSDEFRRAADIIRESKYLISLTGAGISVESGIPDFRSAGGLWEKYDPARTVAEEKAKQFSGHGGSDFYATHFFIEKILGRPDGKWSIDVYKAVDMGICGLLAYRSVLGGNIPVAVPNLRNQAEREQWRNDNACTNPAVAGDQLLPRSSFGEPEFSDAVYDRVKKLWQEGKDA